MTSDSHNHSSPRHAASSIGAMSRRAALGALAASAAGFALFGPRGAKERTDGKVVLDYWEKWTGHEGRAMQKVVDEFNATLGERKRIFVRYLVTAGIDQKTLISVAGGNPPDVVGLWNFNVPLYAECNAVLPLDELGASHGLKVENYAPGFRAVMEHPDARGKRRMWGVVNTGGTVAMYYNKAAFREVGLDPERPPRTISELDEYDQKLMKVGSDGEIIRAGFLHSEPGWWSWIWGYHFGGTLADTGSNRSLVASPENVAAFEWMQSYARRYGVDAVKKFKSLFAHAYDSPQNALLDGKCAMVVQGPWLANVINAKRPSLDYGVAPFPVLDRLYSEGSPYGLVDCDVLVIPRGVKNPEASMEFVAYTQRQEVVEFMAREHFKNSPLVASSDDFLRTHPNRGVRVHDAIAQSDKAYLCPRTRTWPQFKDELDAAMQRMWGLEESAAAVLATVRSRTQEFLDRAAAQRAKRSPGGASGGGVAT
jgi:multiple sugar transport system substrate-binding protein